MGYHRISPIATRLRLNRSFDSAWYADATQYAKVLQKDWLLTKSVWSFVQRSSRTKPRTELTKEQQLQQLSEQRLAIESGQQTSTSQTSSAKPQTQNMRDYPNFRVGRIFTQHLPYKTYASTFAYVTPKEGPQKKYGLFPSRFR